MIITAERLANVQSSVDKLVVQGQVLFADISETVQDRARLLREAEEREYAIDRLNNEALTLQERIRSLEARNERLSEETVRLESELIDANARLDSIREAASGEAPRTNGDAPVRRLTIAESGR